ncbi:MAG: HAMP domain-containing sensor histidine kinase [Thermodesulfobacteriota bacterium]
MNRTRWLVFSISVFVFSTIALGISLWLFIYWYIKVRSGLQSLMIRFNISQTDVASVHTWVVITVLSILVGLILIGLFLIFYYNLKAFQLFRMQKNFIDNFTHELKTPVTSLRLFLETFLRHDLKREEQVKYLNAMIEDVNRLSSTIGSILNLAEIQGKTYAGHFEVRDIVSFTSRFIEKNRHVFKNAVIRMDNRTSDPCCFCRINDNLFEMLLMNLLTNAVKYNTSRTPRVDILFEQQNNKYIVRFIDNGIGIPRSERKKIFKKFYQAGDAQTRSAKGNGLGLYLVAGIVKVHRGTIQVEAAPGDSGTDFTVTLPAAETPAAGEEEGRT